MIVYFLETLIGPPPKPVITAKIIPFPQKEVQKRPKRVDEWTRYLSDDQPDFILMGFRDRYGDVEALYIPKVGPRYTVIFWYRIDWQTGRISEGHYMGHAIKRAIKWDDPEFHWTGALHLLPPNPDRRVECLACKGEAVEAVKNET
jgi:hypothetical protein